MRSCVAPPTSTGIRTSAGSTATRPSAISRATEPESAMNLANRASRSDGATSFMTRASASARRGAKGRPRTIAGRYAPACRRSGPVRATIPRGGTEHRNAAASTFGSTAATTCATRPPIEWPTSTAGPMRSSASRTSRANPSIRTRPRSGTGRLPFRPRSSIAQASRPRSAATGSHRSHSQAPAQRPCTNRMGGRDVAPRPGRRSSTRSSTATRSTSVMPHSVHDGNRRSRARRWARQVSNLRPLACEASALPLSYAPGRHQR